MLTASIACRRRVLACAVLTLLGALPGGQALAQFALTRTFTPGPAGDLVVYPRSLNPARQVPGTGGAGPSNFHANGIVFQNVSGNPAYFDASNLLTRPAQLISNEAFWTDPRKGTFLYNGAPFDICNMGMTLQDTTPSDTFSFDVAIAAVDTDLPTFAIGEQDYAYLDFQVQDDNFNVAYGRLVFGDLGTRAGSDFFASQAGTFQTLNSPRTAYEARFQFSQQELMTLLREQQDPANPTPPAVTPIRFFDINLMSIATPSGTKQFAMDNVVINNGTRPVESPDPLVYQPQQPVGRNTPIYLILDPLASTDEYPDGSAVVAGEAEPGQYKTLTSSGFASVTNPVNEILNGLKTDAVSVSVPGDVTDGGLSVRPESVGSNIISKLGEVLNGTLQAVGHPVTVQSLTPDEREVLVQLQTNLAPLLGQSLNDLKQSDEAAYQALIQRIEAERVRIEAGNNVQQGLNSLRVLMLDLTGNRAEGPASLLEAGLEGGPAPELFVGYSLNEYLDLMRLEGTTPTLGDTGGYFQIITDANGQVIDVIANNWVVGTTEMTYVSAFSFNVPEPTSMAVIGSIAALGLSRRRR